MANHIKKLLIAILLCNTFSTLLPYTWTLNNFTKKRLLIRLKLLASNNPYFVLIPPRQSAEFKWEIGNAMAGFCLEKIYYVIPTEQNLRLRGLFRYIGGGSNEYEITNNVRLGEYVSEMPQEFPMKEAQLRFMPDALFNQTVEEAKKLSGTSVGAKIVGWFADLVAQSKCRSRDIKIIEKNGEIGFYTLAN